MEDSPSGNPQAASDAVPNLGRRLLTGFTVLAALAAVYATRTADADLWGHLRYGQFFTERRAVPDSDPFAFTSAGRTWVHHEYLSEVFLWLSYAAAGSMGLVGLKCLVGGITVWLHYRAVRVASDDPRVWAPVLLLTSHVLCRWFHFRPQLFTFLFFALFLRVLFAHLLGRPARLWVLPPAMALWVNLHGGFLAGFGAVGLAFLLRSAQLLQVRNASLAERSTTIPDSRSSLKPSILPLALTFLACSAASLLNPMGGKLWPYLATELSCDANHRFLAEWQPLNFHADGWTACTFVVLVAALGGACVAAGPGRTLAGLPGWQWLVSCAPLAVAASCHVRHVPLFALWTAPVLALLGQAAFVRLLLTRPGRVVWTATAGLAAVPALMTVGFVLARPALEVSTGDAVLGVHSPYGAAAYLRANGLHGRVYNPLWWGSYLTWELYPEILVSMDGRNVTLFAAQDVAENLAFFLAQEADPAAPLRHDPDFLLVPADAPVLPRLRDDWRWAVLHDDGDAVLFGRSGLVWPRRLVSPIASAPRVLR
jgi:hypothetical protein